MRAFATLILGILLIAGLATGAALHAAELAGGTEVTAATTWLHSAGDHDEVPADADKNYPHHHNQCGGHDVAAPLKACALGQPVRVRTKLTPPATAALAPLPAARMLRPPIA